MKRTTGPAVHLPMHIGLRGNTTPSMIFQQDAGSLPTTPAHSMGLGPGVCDQRMNRPISPAAPHNAIDYQERAQELGYGPQEENLLETQMDLGMFVDCPPPMRWGWTQSQGLQGLQGSQKDAQASC